MEPTTTYLVGQKVKIKKMKFEERGSIINMNKIMEKFMGKIVTICSITMHQNKQTRFRINESPDWIWDINWIEVHTCKLNRKL